MAGIPATGLAARTAAQDSLGKYLSRISANDIYIGGMLTRGEGKNGVTIHHGVRRADGARQAVMGHLGHLIHLLLVQFRIGSNYTDHGVAPAAKTKTVLPISVCMTCSVSAK